MDWGAAAGSIARDLEELAAGGPAGWLALAVVLGLPFAAGVVFVRRRWLAGWLALAAWLVPAAVWVLYYATDLWSPWGMEEAVRHLASFLVGWVVLGIDAVVRRRRRAPLQRTSLSPA